MTDIKHLDDVMHHIKNVQDNCFILGRKLIQTGEVELGRMLIANSLIHDNSKFYGIEWEFMDPDTTNKAGLKNAVKHHAKTNPHHPEYWDGIEKMPKVYVYEMVADWKARSEEFGSDLRAYINGQALKKYNFTKESAIYKLIMDIVNMICAKPFEPLEEHNEETIKKELQEAKPSITEISQAQVGSYQVA